MHVARRLHICENVVLKLRNRLQWVGNVLVLLNVANNLRGLTTLGEIDKVGLLDD